MSETSVRAEEYALLIKQLQALIAGERNQIANLANAAALLYHTLQDINWAGFYLIDSQSLDSQELVLGPFQGKPACVRIALGKGVCGTAAARRATVLVPDVHEFPGHIACDPTSRSEMVIPLLSADGHLVGVLDIDSPVIARFDATDQLHLEAFVEQLSHTLA